MLDTALHPRVPGEPLIIDFERWIARAAPFLRYICGGKILY